MCGQASSRETLVTWFYCSCEPEREKAEEVPRSSLGLQGELQSACGSRTLRQQLIKHAVKPLPGKNGGWAFLSSPSDLSSSERAMVSTHLSIKSGFCGTQNISPVGF